MRIFKPTKLITSVTLASYIALSLFMSASAMAADSPATDSNFCNRLNEISKQITTNISARQLDLDKGSMAAKIQQRRNDFSAHLKSDRSSWDKIRIDQYTALQGHAKNDSQKAAIENYKTTMENAIAVRRQAVDAAITTYRQAVDALIDSKQDNVSDTVTKFQNQVQAAFSTAQTQCSSNIPPVQVRQNLIDNLRTARQLLDSDRENLDKIHTQIVSLDQTKRAAIEAAIQEFKQTAETAAQTLRASLGGDQSLIQPNLTRSL